MTKVTNTYDISEVLDKALFDSGVRLIGNSSEWM